jgi:hypothetical protein
MATFVLNSLIIITVFGVVIIIIIIIITTITYICNCLTITRITTTVNLTRSIYFGIRITMLTYINIHMNPE